MAVLLHKMWYLSALICSTSILFIKIFISTQYSNAEQVTVWFVIHASHIKKSTSTQVQNNNNMRVFLILCKSQGTPHFLKESEFS